MKSAKLKSSTKINQSLVPASWSSTVHLQGASNSPDAVITSTPTKMAEHLELLEERRQKEDALFELNQLRISYDDVLLKYAEAKNMIDRLRFGPVPSEMGMTDSETMSSWQQLEISSAPSSEFLSSTFPLNGSSVRGQRQSCPAFLRFPFADCPEPIRGGDDQEADHFLECVPCSCPPTAKQHWFKSKRTAVTQQLEEAIKSARPDVEAKKTIRISQSNARLKAQCLQDQVQSSMTALQDDTTDDAVKSDHLSHLRLQLQDVRNEVKRLETVGANVDSLEELVTKLDSVISEYDEDDDEQQWVSTSSSSYASVDDDDSDHVEFKRDLNEKLVAIKSLVDTSTIKRRNHRLCETHVRSIVKEPVLSRTGNSRKADGENRGTDEYTGSTRNSSFLPFIGSRRLISSRPNEVSTDARTNQLTEATSSKQRADNDGRRRRLRRCCMQPPPDEHPTFVRRSSANRTQLGRKQV